MDANEKAQRLMLVTDIKFRLDNKTGELIESEHLIPQEKMDEAMAMTDEEFKQRIKDQQKRIHALGYNKDFYMRAAYYAYVVNALNPLSFDAFVENVMDHIESL